MATKLEDKQGVDGDADSEQFNDIAQQYYDDTFNQLTSQEHLSKDATPGDVGAGEDASNTSSPSPEQIKSAEESGAGASAASDKANLGAEAGIAGGAAAAASLFNPVEGPAGKLKGLRNVFWGSAKRRRNSVGGGIAGISVGGLLFAAVIGSGPFEFIHLAQLLTQFHFANMQNASDDRTSKLFRFIHYTQGKPEYSRMGVVGNKLASTIETKMNANGIESAYTDKFGNFDGYVIDTTNERFKGMTTDEIKQYFAKNYQVTLTDGAAGDTKLAGKLVASADGLGYFKSRAMVRSMMSDSGYSKISSALGARIMGRRAGISWHPLKQLDTKVQTALEDWWKGRNSAIENGAEPTLTTEVDAKSNSGATTAQQNDAATAQGTANDLTQKANQVATDVKTGNTSSLSALQDSVHVKLGLGAAAVVGVACLAYGVAENADKLKQTEVVLPLMRMGMDAITVGNQIMSGQDVNSAELGKLTQQLNSTEQGNVGSWSSAQSVQAEQGQKLTGVDATTTMKSVGKGAPFSFLTHGAIGGVLKPACSTVGTILLTAVSFIAGPVSVAAGTIASLLTSSYVSDLVQNLAGWLVGTPINPATLAGPAYGNAVNYGARLAADQQAIAAGGTAFSSAQAAQLKTTETLASQADFHSKSLAYQLFNPDDARSVVSHVIDSFSPSTTQNIASMFSGFMHIGSSITSSFGSLFTGLAHAAPVTAYDYGFAEYGFSEADLNNPLVENPFANADTAATLLDNNNNQNNSGEPDYIGLANQCFGVSLVKTPDPEATPANSLTWEVLGGTTTPKLSDIEKQNCLLVGDNHWLSIRFFIFDTENMESIGCYENDQQSCANIGMNNGTVSYGAAATNTVAVDSRALPKTSQITSTSSRTTTIAAVMGNLSQRNLIRGAVTYAAAAA